MEYIHKPVLLEEAVSFLSPVSPGMYVDATVGGGGHAENILEESSPLGRLVGIDIDPAMLFLAKSRLHRFGDRVILIEGNFINLPAILSRLKIEKIDGIIFDLGVSMKHFMTKERGFSFSLEGPLDMRLSPSIKLTAGTIINEWEPGDLISILYKYGEEYNAKKIVKRIIEERKKNRITTTTKLAEIIKSAVYTKRIHPATKTFQALRIAVNGELPNIEKALPQAVSLLKKGGRLCVISFHSLEDRLVKNIFQTLANPCTCPSLLPHCVCGKEPEIKIITRRPVIPSEKEIEENPASRSAKLRVAEKHRVTSFVIGNP